MTSVEAMNTDCMTLERFILKQQKKHSGATGDFTYIMNAIVSAVKSISSAVRRAGMTGMYGVAGNQNATGDNVQKLDALSNELFINMLKSTGSIAAMVSEENENIIEVHEEGNQGKYYAYFDPLDGSSNIDCLVSIGSIFGIAKKETDDIATDILKPGNKYIVSGYTLYGSATMLVLALNNEVNGFTLDPSIGEFILTDCNMKIKEQGKIYSINEGYTEQWTEKGVRKYVEAKKKQKSPYGARYIGSMVADVHRTLKYGGIFMYPGTQASPNGKLRLLYECKPMAHIIHTAGGKAVTGEKNGKDILDVVPTHLHARSPIVLGSTKDVDEYLEFVNASN